MSFMKRFFVSAAVLTALFLLAACEARVEDTDFTFPRWVILSYVAYVAAVILIAHFYLLRCCLRGLKQRHLSTVNQQYVYIFRL